MNGLIFGVLSALFVMSCNDFEGRRKSYEQYRRQYEAHKPRTQPPLQDPPQPRVEPDTTPQPPVTSFQMNSYVMSGNWDEISKILNTSRWSINDHFGQHRETLLHAAVDNYLKTGNLEFLEFILNRPGLDVNMGDIQNSSPLHRAASGTSEWHLRATELLLKKGAQQFSNYATYTPLDEALHRVEKCNTSSVAKKLCEYGGLALRFQYSCVLGWYDPSCNQKQDSGNKKSDDNNNSVIFPSECLELFSEKKPNFQNEWNAKNNHDKWVFFTAKRKELYIKYSSNAEKKTRLNTCRDEVAKLLGKEKSSKTRGENPWDNEK